MKKFLPYSLLFLLMLGCEKWYTTEDVSRVSQLPKFTLNGGEFVSFLQNDTAEYTDPGATAYANGEELNVRSFGNPDLSRPGVYTIQYYAQNQDNLEFIAQRIIAVTYEDVSMNDLSGIYEGTNWETEESKVEKIDANGLYECEDVMGYFNFEMPGRFVDLGNNELVLLNGEGYFGNYAASLGEYTLSTLTWTISLTDPPNEGVEIDVLWRKKIE